MRVVGVMKPKGRSLTWIYSLDGTICLPLTTYQQRLEGIGYVEHLIVFFKKGIDFYKVIDCAKDTLRRRHRGQDDFIGVLCTPTDVPSPGTYSKGDKDCLGPALRVFRCLSAVSAS